MKFILSLIIFGAILLIVVCPIVTGVSVIKVDQMMNSFFQLPILFRILAGLCLVVVVILGIKK